MTADALQVADSLQNLTAGLATDKSKLTSDAFLYREPGDAQLTAMYRGDWMARKIVDIPVFDMLREWRKIHGVKPEQVTLFEAVEKKHQVAAKLSKAMRWARLFGGAGIVIGAETARPDQPLDPQALKGKGSLKYLTVLPKQRLQADGIENDISSASFGLPRMYIANIPGAAQIQVHPSRVLRFVGRDRLDIDAATDGYGDSTLGAIYDAIHHAALVQTGTAELVHEAKVDVISIPSLGANFATKTATDALIKRFSTANTLKSINNMLLLDATEKWERKTTSFTGLPDVLDRYLQIVSGASDIPATRLLGQAPKGLNSTGDSDLRNYYDMLAGERDTSIGPIIDFLDRFLWTEAIGSVPADAYFEWRPMWQMTPSEKADVDKKKAETTKIYVDMALFEEQTFAEGVASQLSEDGTYPGLEEAIAKLRLVAPHREPDEIDASAENDNPPSDRSGSGGRGNAKARA